MCYDAELLKYQIKEVVRYSQCIMDPQVDDLVERWASAKEKFINRFGGKLIVEWPVPLEIHLDPHDRRVRASEVADYVSNVFHNDDLASFIDQNIDSFFDNKVVNTVNGVNIPKGMKLVKAFKYFEKDKKTLRNIQDFASAVIQEDKIKGVLCFSVHPLDFLSSSENTYNWRSCHSLDGEYRSGNLSYMVDETTFMVYIKNADDTELNAFGPNIKWNSKKWRVLMHASLDDQILFAGRQYPFSSKSGLDEVLSVYNSICYHDKKMQKSYYAANTYDSWSSAYVDRFEDDEEEDWAKRLEEKYLVVDRKLIALNEVVSPGRFALNYNDLLHSSCYVKPYYAIFNKYSYHSIKEMRDNPIVIGGSVKCLHCGKHKISNAETMRCDECELEYGYEENELYGSCACCGRRIYLDDAPIVGGEDLVCDYCYDSECFECSICGETHYNSDSHYIKFNENEDGYVCRYCFINATEEPSNWRY